MPSYEIIDGKKVLKRAGTKNHKEGNAPRDASDNRLDRPAPAETKATHAKGGKKV